ncbi:plasmid mobilization protein [Pedobacter steynii]
MMMVRMTSTERLLIESKSKAAGMKPSEWCRKAAKVAKVIARFSPEEMSWFRTLSGLANNLNQLTHQAHVSGLFSLGIKCRTLLVQIESLLTKISNYDR